MDLRKLMRNISVPIQRNYVFFIVMYIILIVDRITCEFDAKSNVEALLQIFIDVYIYGALLTLFPQKYQLWLKRIAYIIMYTFTATEVFLYMRFGMRFSPSTIILCMETNPEESGGFARMCFESIQLYATLLICVSIGIIHFFLGHRNKWLKRIFANPRLAIYENHWCLVRCLLIFTLAIIGASTWFTRQKELTELILLDNSRDAEKYPNTKYYSAPQRFAYAVIMYNLIQKESDIIARRMQTIKVQSCDFRCPKVVFIIGESHNKHHSHLYGYTKPTTPFQDSLQIEGKLVAFSDAVSPANLTSNVFKNMLSTHVADQGGNWTDGVLFPALFKKAGYKVAFLSNQFYMNKDQTNCDLNGSFFINRSDLNAMCFDKRSTLHYTVDGCFLYDEVRNYKLAEKELLIVHLYGQHVYYKDRTTDKYKTLKPSDYPERTDLNSDELQTLVDYDNACLYNDIILGRIYSYYKDEDVVFVYISDHGEYVFDGQEKRFGRSHYDKITNDIAHNEYEVPMEIFFTDKFVEAHPDVVKRLNEVKDDPYTTDALPHLMQGLVGLHSNFYSPEYDPFSTSYTPKHKRLIRETVDYDQLMKSAK